MEYFRCLIAKSSNRVPCAFLWPLSFLEQFETTYFICQVSIIPSVPQDLLPLARTFPVNPRQRDNTSQQPSTDQTTDLWTLPNFPWWKEWFQLRIKASVPWGSRKARSIDPLKGETRRAWDLDEKFPLLQTLLTLQKGSRSWTKRRHCKKSIFLWVLSLITRDLVSPNW